MRVAACSSPHANSLLGMCKFPLEHLSAGRRIERRRQLTSRSALYKNKYFPLPRIVFASLIIIYRCLRAAKKRRAAGDRQKNRVSPGRSRKILYNIICRAPHARGGRGYIKWSLRIHVCKKLARKAAFPGTHGNAPALLAKTHGWGRGGRGGARTYNSTRRSARFADRDSREENRAAEIARVTRFWSTRERPSGRPTDLCVCVAIIMINLYGVQMRVSAPRRHSSVMYE